MNILKILAAPITIDVPGIPTPNASTAIGTVIAIAFMVTGAMSVLFILVGAIMYAISNGEQSKISQAKNTIMYALIGLAVSLSAFTIVQFVTGQVSTP